MRRNPQPQVEPQRVVRCAIYCRKSTEEGLEQEFNSLDAQRECGEAFIKSQAHEGWLCTSTGYSDGGYSGGNIDRPALQRLLADVKAGKVDCVVVYKVDRLSRSLLDFAKMMELFEQHGVSFVSVTQQINTSSSMGRLMLNVLLSFAQFEREIISERTRDKIASARRKGRWSGGQPILGYDVVETKLVVNPDEAQKVRQIFQLYLDYGSLLATANEINRRGWTSKTWTTHKGLKRGGHEFGKNKLHYLLTNPAYVGKVRYKHEVHPGLQEAIVDDAMFAEVQSLLSRNGQTGGRAVRNKHGALLKGLLQCKACGCAMAHSYTSRGKRRYRYYTCTKAQQQGWQHCPAPSIPAAQIEQFVVDEIRCIGKDPALVAETLSAVSTHGSAAVHDLEAERRNLGRQLRADYQQIQKLAPASDSRDLEELAAAQERVRHAEQRAAAIDQELESLRCQFITEQDVTRALADFSRLWESLSPREQTKVVQLLIESVTFDGEAGSISITFHPTGLKALAGNQLCETESAA